MEGHTQESANFLGEANEKRREQVDALAESVIDDTNGVVQEHELESQQHNVEHYKTQIIERLLWDLEKNETVPAYALALAMEWKKRRSGELENA